MILQSLGGVVVNGCSSCVIRDVDSKHVTAYAMIHDEISRLKRQLIFY